MMTSQSCNDAVPKRDRLHSLAQHHGDALAEIGIERTEIDRRDALDMLDGDLSSR